MGVGVVISLGSGSCVRTQWNKVRKDNGKEFFPTRLYEEV